MRGRTLALFSRLVQWVTLGLSAIVLAYLGGQLFGQQAYMPLTKVEDMVFRPQVWSYPIWLVLALVGLLALAPLLKKLSLKQLYVGLALPYLLAGLWLISQVDDQLRADARSVFEAALAMNRGDFSSLTQAGGYLYLHPHQLGLVSLERLYLLVSESSRLIFGINLVLVLLTLAGLAVLTQRLFGQALASKYVLLLSFTCLPQFFFILFAYGAIPGAFLVVWAAVLFQAYEAEQQSWQAVAGVLAAAGAALVRNNYQIFLIALVVVWLAAYGRRPLKTYLGLSLGLVASLVVLNLGLQQAYAGAIGQPLSPGVPKLAYVTMGLQEDPKGAVGGWWNTYNTQLLDRVSYDQEKAQAQVKADLQKEVARLAGNPKAALQFFQRKAHSTWLDPTFQSVWTGPLKEVGQDTHNALLASVYNEGRGYHWLNRYGGVWLGLVYLLAAGFWFLKKGRAEVGNHWYLIYLPYVFFLGGGMFHLIWETKSQYVLSYVLFLLPSAGLSLAQLAEWTDRTLRRLGQGA